jgi:hypothetical protein
VHAPTQIRLGSLRRVLPEKQSTDAGKIVKVTFEEVRPGPGKDSVYHPTIKTFLEETSLEPLDSDKRKQVDYRGSSANVSAIILANTWFGRGTIRCSDPLQVESILRSENVAHRQDATPSSADVISFACAGPHYLHICIILSLASQKTIYGPDDVGSAYPAVLLLGWPDRLGGRLDLRRRPDEANSDYT